MKKLLRSFVGTAPGILVLIVASAAAPVLSEFDGAMLPSGDVEVILDGTQLETFTFGSSWPTGGTSRTALVEGHPYRIEILGSFAPFGEKVDARHDAECGWTTTTVSARNDALDDTGGSPDVYVNGGEVDWVATTEDPVGTGCNALNNTYTLIYTPPTAGFVNLRVNEPEFFGYNDNVGEFTVRLFLATAEDPANPGLDPQSLIDEATVTAGGAATTVSSIVEEELNGGGVDPGDPEGTVNRKQEQVETEAAAAQAAAEAKAKEAQDEVEGQLPDPNEVVGDVEGIVEQNDPGDPGGVDTGPVTEAVGTVLDEVERNTPDEDPEIPDDTDIPGGDPGVPGDVPGVPPEAQGAADEAQKTVGDAGRDAEEAAEGLSGDDVPNPAGDLGSGGDTPPTTSPPTTTPPTTSPPTTSPPTTTPPTTSPPTTTPPDGGGSGGGSTGSSGDGDTGGTEGSGSDSNSADDSGSGQSAPVGGFSVTEIAAPPANDASGTGGTSAGATSVKGNRVTNPGAAPSPSGAAANGAGSAGAGDFGLAELGIDSVELDGAAEEVAGPRRLAPEPKKDSQLFLFGLAIAVLFGTFEMGRRAWVRIRAERAYDTYGY